MVASFLRDKKRVVTCAAQLNGEYGVKGYYMGVPAVIGAGGVERIIELDLRAVEKKQLKKSIDHVKQLVKVIQL